MAGTPYLMRLATGLCAPKSRQIGTDVLAPIPANVAFEAAAAVPTSGVTALQARRDGVMPRSNQEWTGASQHIHPWPGRPPTGAVQPGREGGCGRAACGRS
ncbi:hypothetical protein ACTMTI_10605 [Nonomuraea sp. H19]|uniref:hypothetical protein n=1 Tax=Nonomuraea sp. H19 TaxID=3452206 RepID=UPI003F89CBFC